MSHRRVHYDSAFGQYLRSQTVPCLAIDEARRALSPASLRLTAPQSASCEAEPADPAGGTSLKNFDFVVYAQPTNWLVDVKGRKHAGKSRKSLDNWVTLGDVDSLLRWQQLFGPGFKAVFVFLYWCQEQPPDALFQEIFEVGNRWYSVLAVDVDDYRRHMRPRSARWDTVCLSADCFRQLARPLRELLAA